MTAARRALRLRAEVEAEVPKTAMVMAAGLGKRMRPLTATRPKPLVEVAGRPLIDHVLDRLKTAGVEKIVVNVHYLPGSIEAHLASRSHGLEFAISDERGVLLETGGGMVKAAPMIDADPFLVVNSDNLWIDGPADTLKLLASHWDGKRMDALLLLVPHARAQNHRGMGDFHMERSGRLRRREKAACGALRLHRHPNRVEGAAGRALPRGRSRRTSCGTAPSRPGAASARCTRASGSTSERPRPSARPKLSCRMSDGRAARPAVFTIPTHRSFADSLAAGLIAKFGSDSLGLASGRILLPNNRAVRTLTEAFVRASGSGLLLPRLIPIGDPELDERVGGALDPADDIEPVAARHRSA